MSTKTAAPARRARTGLLAYLYSSMWAHRIVPLRLALPLMAAYGRRRWRKDKSFREGQIAYRSLIVHGTPREGEGAAIAERAAQERLVQREIEWRPWILAKTQVEGWEHFETAKAAGRGLILTTTHTGPQGAWGRALALRGEELYAPAGDWMFTEQREGYQGRAARKMFEVSASMGIHLVHRGGTFQKFVELLEDGRTLWLPCDVPGTSQMTLVGKRTNVSSGPAALSMLTGAPIVAGFGWRDGRRPRVRIHEPFYPGDYEDADALRAAVGVLADQAILDQPHAMSTVFTPYLWSEDWPKYFS